MLLIDGCLRLNQNKTQHV